MHFKDKLVFLMNLTQTSNKELANGISVDPSLISLLRTGKRKQPQNPNHIKHMAVFFARKCSADYQRNALAEMLGQNSIRSSMPSEVLAKRLESWLIKDSDIMDYLVEGMEEPYEKQIDTRKTDVTFEHEKNSGFYFGEEGRREVMRLVMQMIRELETPGTILISSDDNLEWLLSDYMLTKQIQTDLLEIIEKGFTFHQIMPAINFLPRYAEALQFWLPMYNTGHVKVSYYPRLRDNLYRRSMIILPERCVRISSAIGLGSSSDVTMFSTDPKVVNAYTHQFQEHMSLCRPALASYSDPKDFYPHFQDFFSRKGDTIQMTNVLSANTLPKKLLERCILESDRSLWKDIYQQNLNYISTFESNFKEGFFIDMTQLAAAEDIRSGKVSLLSAKPTDPGHLRYTPETYILHLENILRLMDEYENYYFVPYQNTQQEGYNLFVNNNGLALMMRTSGTPMMLEIYRPEMVMACQEYLMRQAEKLGYKGIHKTKNIRKIKELIRELQH